MQRLEEYPWPGNIRELENVLERAVILAAGPTLDIAPDVLPMPAVSPTPPTRNESSETVPQEEMKKREDSLEAVERDHILAVLQQTNWVLSGPRGAAQILGLNPSTLRNRMKKLGLIRSPR